ncbi:MAG: MFS transporter [Saprospiraceae bacterium]|nr:MFS transporter [Saprospiraceae bacterium]
MFGSWVTHIPHVKTTLGLNDAQLGLALFGMPLGLLLMNPVSPMLLHRAGLVNTTIWSTLAMAISFALPIWMPSQWALMGALFLVGLSIAVLNVAINTCATHVENAEGIYIMSSCHGMWSMGGMLGSGASAILIAAGVSPHWHLGVLALLVMAGAWWGIRPALAGVPEAEDSDAGGSKFVLPTRDLLLMIFIGLSVSLCEGVAFDWSAVYLRDSLGATAQVAALGFSCFSLTMMAMRFTGDVLIPRFGERALLYFSAVLSIAAILVIILSGVPAVGILGFLLLGAGVALGAPILFNAAARVPGLAPGAGLATYATFSFVGFLAGPPVIGFVGETYGFGVAFGAVAILVVLAIPAIRRVRL